MSGPVTEEVFGIRAWIDGRWQLVGTVYNTRKEARNDVRKFDVRCPGCGGHGHFARVVHARIIWEPSGRCLPPPAAASNPVGARPPGETPCSSSV